MGDVLIVDGYNVIHQHEQLKKIFMKSMDDARFRLIEILANYVSYIGWTLMIVFDAHKVKDGIGSCEQYDSNTHIVFTGKNETADSFIEKMVHDMTNECNIWVATSDKDEQYYVITQGANRISARELWIKITDAENKMMENKKIKHQTIQNNFLKNRIDSTVRDRLEKMRRGFY